ncbi:MAG: hypothetical protein KDA93_10195 [Planctomycetaceae bacterium]|nr:hypothetical protein [Planctomycetaceae bacterium]
MRERLLAVAKTYWTRPLVWVLGVIWLGFLIAPFMLAQGSRTRPSHPVIELPPATINKLEQLNYVREHGLEAEVKGLRLDRLWADFARGDAVWNEERQAWEASALPIQMDVAFDVVEELPNVDVLVCDHLLLTPTGLTRLGHLTRISQLSLSGVQLYDESAALGSGKAQIHRLAADDLVALSRLTQLEVLDLSQCDFTGGLHHLAGLPKLHTLILSSSENLNDAALADLAQLPHLQTLVISPIYVGRQKGYPEKVVTDEGLETLANVPQLSTVYVGTSGAFSQPVDKLQAILPNVSVRRGFYDEKRVRTFVMLELQACVVLSLLLCLHVLGQFSLPTAHLVPRFATAHLQHPILLMAIHIAVLTALAVSHKAALLPSLSLVTVSLAIILWLGYGITSDSPRRVASGSTNGQWIALPILILVFGSLPMTFAFPTQLDAFLLGDAGWLASLLLLLLGGVGVLTWCQRCTGEAQRFAAVGVTTVFSWGDHVRHQHDLQAKVLSSKKENRWLRFGRRFLEAALRQPRMGHAVSLRLWRAGVTRTELFMAYMVVPFLAPLLLFRWSRIVPQSPFESGSSDPYMAFLPVLMMIPLMGLCQVGNSWRQRLPGLGAESLRPMTREHLRRLMFLGVAWDLVPPLVVFWGIVGVVISRGSLLDETMLVQVAITALNLFGLIGFYVFMMWMLLIRRWWIILLVVGVVYIAGIVVFLSVKVTKGDIWDSVTEVHVSLMIVGAIMGLVAWLYYTWRRWGTVEIGMLDR